jgi:hypothetical protein
MAPGAAASVKLHLKNVTNIFRSTFGVERVWLQVAVGGEPGAGCEPNDAFMRVQLMMASCDRTAAHHPYRTPSLAVARRRAPSHADGGASSHARVPPFAAACARSSTSPSRKSPR